MAALSASSLVLRTAVPHPVPELSQAMATQESENEWTTRQLVDPFLRAWFMQPSMAADFADSSVSRSHATPYQVLLFVPTAMAPYLVVIAGVSTTQNPPSICCPGGQLTGGGGGNGARVSGTWVGGDTC